MASGNLSVAASVFEEILAKTPLDPEALFSLGAIHHRQGRVELAQAAFREVLCLQPNNLQAHLALAATLLESSNPQAAVNTCSLASAVAPDNPGVWYALGVAQYAAGDKEAALQSYDRVLQLDHNHADALNNRGPLLTSLGRISDAVENNRLLVRRLPFSAQAHFNLGESLVAARNYSEAVASYRRALRLDPNSAILSLHTGYALSQCEKLDEAQRLLDHAALLDADLVSTYRKSIFRDGDSGRLDARTLLLLRHYDLIEQCEWENRDRFLQTFSALIRDDRYPPLSEKALGFRAMAMGLDLLDQRQLATGIATAISQSCKPIRQFGPSSKKGRLRVGYVSPDFRMHPIGLLTSRLYAWHDRVKFEVYCYTLSDDDGSFVRDRVEHGCDRFVDLSKLSDADAAERIRGDDVDILVDMAGYTDGSRPRIFAAYPAPLQISWLGYASTMGAPWIDALVADEICLPPECEQYFTEALVRLPAGQYLCSYANETVDTGRSRSDVGLPDGLVLSAMHNPYKIDPDVFALWMRVLARHPRAVLWLLETTSECCERLKNAAIAAGVSADRLIFAPRASHCDHLARLRLADIVLDTPQCNGSTTICDALVAGVPVVSCLGTTFSQRMAASVLGAAELLEWVVPDLIAYENLVNQHLENPESLFAARKRLDEVKGHALFFRPHDWVRYLEAGYEQLWDAKASGEPMVPITITI